MRRRNQKARPRSRTTIELSAENGRRLRQMAAARGEKGFSKIIGEALKIYFDSQAEHEKLREKVLASLRGPPDDSAATREYAEAILRVRDEWDVIQKPEERK